MGNKDLLVEARLIYAKIHSEKLRLKEKLIELTMDKESMASAILNLKEGHTPSTEELEEFNHFKEKYL